MRSLERNNEKRKVFWALERKQWTMQRKRNARKERRKKECVIWGMIDSVGKGKTFGRRKESSARGKEREKHGRKQEKWNT